MARPAGITSTTSAPTSSSPAASSRQAQSRSAVVIPPGSGVPVPGANAGSSTSMSIVANAGPGPDRRDRLGEHVGDPALVDRAHRQRR